MARLPLKRALKAQERQRNNKTTAVRKERQNSEPDSPTMAKGRFGEDVAAKYLTSRGFRILDRNVRVGHGEIDILAKDGDELVFVEVRTRGKGWLMSAEESVGPRKLSHIIAAGRGWTEGHNYNGFWRVDLISITIEEGCEPAIEHLQNITEPIL